MRKLNFLILFISMAFACSLYGQLPEQYENIKSPNSSSLGQYGDIPVSHFTGTPDIGIELYGISVSGRTIPVSLNYHTSGIKPDNWIRFLARSTIFTGFPISRIKISPVFA
mgnify:CR=1 FL=1